MPDRSTRVVTIDALHDAYQGEHGVTDVINLLNEELVQAMRLMGCKKLADIERSMVAHQSSYHAKL